LLALEMNIQEKIGRYDDDDNNSGSIENGMNI
jgi:hypothetical protein